MTKSVGQYLSDPRLLGIAVLIVCALWMSAVTSLADESGLTIDDRFSEISKQIPEFGGGWVEGDVGTEDAVLHLWLVDRNPGIEARVRELLIQFLGDRFDQSRIEVHEEGIPFAQLQEWRIAMRQHVLPLPGATGLDIDETQNQITLWLSQPQDQSAAVKRELTDLGIPRDAVEIRQGSPPELDVGHSWEPLGWYVLFVAGGLTLLGWSGKQRWSRRQHRQRS